MTALKLKAASLLYNYAFPLYRALYFGYKKKQNARELEIIYRMLCPGSVVLDIGANIGFYTRFLAERTGPHGKVYGFEPDKTNFRHLANETKHLRNVEVFQKAIASEPGKVSLYQSDLLNVDHRTYKPEKYSASYVVEKTSVDSFVDVKFPVDFIKMDIQGFEMEALKGMTHTLERNTGILLFTEVWNYGLKQAGSSGVELFDFLSSRNFNIYSIDKEKPEKVNRKMAEELETGFYTDTHWFASREELTRLEYPKRTR